MESRNLPTAIELGFKPDYSELSQEQMELLLRVLMSGEHESYVPNIDAPLTIRILRKRIEVMKLLIKFSAAAEVAALILSDDNPGRMMAILIDSIIKYEGKTVTADMLCYLYPMGFYNKNALTEYVDTYLKTRKSKWSEIY